jgi:hypothetical protein
VSIRHDRTSVVRISIIQSNYLPWKGYFDLIASSDLFVVYDSAQFTKNDWRNRNRIMTKEGPVWLSLPIATAGRSGQSIRDARLADTRRLQRHALTLDQTYGKLAGFQEIRAPLMTAFEQLRSCELLHDINVTLLRCLARCLGLSVEFIQDTDVPRESANPTQRIVDICTFFGATSYLTGPAGLSYLELERFMRRGIAVDVIEYDHYSEYPQRGFAPFMHGVSVVDLIANTSISVARRELRGRTHRVIRHKAPV